MANVSPVASGRNGRPKCTKVSFLILSMCRRYGTRGHAELLGQLRRGASGIVLQGRDDL